MMILKVRRQVMEETLSEPNQAHDFIHITDDCSNDSKVLRVLPIITIRRVKRNPSIRLLLWI